MQFQVTYIEFDFDGDDDITPYDMDYITSLYVGEIYDAEDEEDLVDEITCASGWCIKSIDYRIILK